MTREIARRLIGGVWKTNVEDESGSGGGGGGSQTFEMRQATLDFDTAGWIDTYKNTIALATGEWLIECGYVITTGFAGTTSPGDDSVQLRGTGAASQLCAQNSDTSFVSDDGILQLSRDDMLVNGNNAPRRVGSNGYIQVRYTTSDGGPGPTAGQIIVYAVVVPAAS